MAKKLLAFLGANEYKKTTYAFDATGNQQKTYTGYYSTAALAQVLFNDISERNDNYVVVFLTEEARKNNWENRIFYNANREKDSAEKEGLKYELMNAAPLLDENIKPVSIKDGKSTAELWSIVNTLLEEIEDGDEVYLDITTGFRSIPLLSLLVINYARIVKNDVKIKGIYYGAFEAKNKETNQTPIFDLWPMIKVSDWSYAIHSFIKHGSAGEISDLLEDSNGNTSDESNCYLPELGKLLQQFSNNIHMTRGYDLIFQYDYEKLKKCLDEIKRNNETGSYPVAKGLIDRIENTVNHYSNNNIKNGFSAVKWCIEHNLIHQGFILLQETVVTCLIAMAGLKDKKFINCYNLREMFKKAIEKKYNDDGNNLITHKININSIKNLLRADKFFNGLYKMWTDIEKCSSVSDNINDTIKKLDKDLIKDYNSEIDDSFVNNMDFERIKRDISQHVPQDKAESFIQFFKKCLTGLAMINKMDNEYSFLMQELRKARNNLAHGDFNDREISKILDLRKKWDPNSNLLKIAPGQITFRDILINIYDKIINIYDKMEDIVNYVR